MLRSLKLAVLSLGIVASAATAEEADYTVVSYDDAVTCQAIYILVSSGMEEESEDYLTLGTLFELWYDYQDIHYPASAGDRHDEDLQAKAAALVNEAQSLDDKDASQRVDGYLEKCGMLEETVLAAS